MAEIYGFAINVSGNAVQSITAIDQSLNGLENKSTQATGSIAGGFLKAQLAWQALDAVIGAGKSIINFGIQTEQTRTAFDVMLGSVDKGRSMFESLKQWADVTPFDNDTAYQAGRMLLNYGIAAKDIIPDLNMLGDASGGVKSRFDSMVYAFGQIKAAGKLQGQDLRQLIDAGFNPLQEMSAMTGKSMTELKAKMEAGGISFEMMVQAFKHATSEGGRFNGMMDKQSQTVGGLFSTVAGTAQTAMYGMFQRMSPMLKELANTSIGVAQSFAEWVTPKQSELLGSQRLEMQALFEVLKNANIPLDQRREIISKLNTDYKDYIGKQITDKTTLAELTALQDVSNKKMIEKIKITAQQEIFAEYFKKAGAANKTMIEKQINYEQFATIIKEKLAQAKTPEEKAKIQTKYGSAEQLLMNDVNFYKQKAEEANKSLNDILKSSEFKGFSGDVVTKGIQATQKAIDDKLVAKSNAVMGAGINTKALTDSATSTSNLAAGGGLGKAKVINMNFNQPLMQINAGSIDGQDMNDNAEKVVEQLTRELHNIAYEQGIM